MSYVGSQMLAHAYSDTLHALHDARDEANKHEMTIHRIETTIGAFEEGHIDAEHALHIILRTIEGNR